MRRLTLTAAALALLGACQSPPSELTDEQRAAIAEELAQQFDAYAGVVRQLDQDGVMSFFQQGQDVTYAKHGEITRSWSSLAELVRNGWPAYAEVERFEWGELHVQVLAPNVAAVTATFDFAASDTAGSPVSVAGTFSTVWLEVGGAWKIVNLAQTFPVAEVATEET